MCGIFGMFTKAGTLPTRERAAAALARLAHRGPDAHGLWHRPDVGLALGQVRLAILDLDPRSDQPFHGPDCVLVFNGEIFNFRSLRAELEGQGVVFRTQSDTEVIAVGFRHWGPAVFERLRGMFAIALWDERERCLHLARDEFGIKPLCVLQQGNTLLFASEVKAIAALATLDIDGEVLCDLLRWGFPMQDRSLFAGVEFLPPGTRAVYTRNSNGALRRTSHTLWSTAFAYRERGNEPTDEHLREVVEASVTDHMLADVPIAVALSGGLDSSIVAAAATAHTRNLHAHTFTLSDSGDPEVEHASLLATQLGLQHHIARLVRGDVGDWLRAVAWHLEEPIANANALPGYALAAAVRSQHCKVVLVGEGSDELFGGYPWYRLALDPALAASPTALFDAYAARRTQRALLPCLVPAHRQLAEQRHQQQRAAYATFAADFPQAPLAAFLAYDLRTQLQYSQLLRVDRMFMAHGVEARVPFLYRSVLAASAALPDVRKLLPEGGPGRREKVALGQAFSSRLPARIAQRPKFGAQGTVDIWGTWLADGLKSAFARCLTSVELRDARQRLERFLDWNVIAAARLANKHRFAIALLLEAVDGVLSQRPRPDAMPALPTVLSHGKPGENPS